MVGSDRGPPLKSDWAAGDTERAMSSPSDPQPRDIRISWVGYEEMPIVYANQFLMQYQPEGGFVLGIAQATPPALIGDADEIAAQIESLDFVAARTLLRAAVTEHKARELIALLQAGLSKAEEIRQALDPRGGEQS